MFTLYGHSSDIRCVDCNDKIVATGSDDGDIILWNIESGMPEVTIYGHLSSVRSLVFSKNNQIMASGDDGGNIKIWNLSSKELIFDYKLHSSGVSSLVFTSDDQLLVSSGWDRNVNVMASSMSMLFSLNKAQNYQQEGSLIKPVIESSPIKSVVEPESFRFEQEYLAISFQDIQITGGDLRKHLKKCGQEYASRKKEERSKERVRMRSASLEIQKRREERLQREQTQQEQREQEESKQRLRDQEEKDRKEKVCQERKEQAVRERLAREQEEARQAQKKKA